MASRQWAARLLRGLVVGALVPLAAQASDGVSDSQILIGQTLTLQGGKNEYGAAVRAGVETAIAQVNRSGGVGGRKLVFPVRAEHKQEFRALMAQARSLGMKRVAFARSDSETGQLHLANVQRLAKAVGIEAVTDLPFKSDINDAQLAAMVQKIASSGAQMVFNHGGAGMYEKLIRRSRQTGVKAAFFGVNSGSTQLAKHLGDQASGMIFSQVMPSPWERKTALTRAYQDAFTKEKPGEAFSYGSLEGYLTARALVEAIRRAGPNPTRESFLGGLRNVELNVEGTKIAYRTGEHAGMSLVDLSIVTGEGRFRH